MKTMKIWRIVFAMLAAFSLASCSSDSDEYSPAYRSAVINGVKMSLTDANGNSLVNSTEDLGNIIVHGNLPRRDVATSLVEIGGIRYVAFNADLPDENAIEYNADKTIGKGTSTMMLTVGKQTAQLVFTFETTSNDAANGTYGKNSIRIIGIQLGSKVITRDNNEVASDILLPIIIKDKSISIGN